MPTPRPIYSTHVASRARHSRIVSVGGDDFLAVYKEVPRVGWYNLHQPLFMMDVKTVHALKRDINCVRLSTRDGNVLRTVGDDVLAKYVVLYHWIVNE